MKQSQTGSARLWVVIGILVAFMAAVLIYDRTRPGQESITHTSGEAWNKNMLMGKADAPNKFVEYTDYFCSYCGKVQEATGEQFKKEYIDTGKVSFENRIVTVLNGVSPNTEQGAEAAYCSAEQNKYWEYSHHIVPRIKADYWDKGIGVKEVPSPVPIAKLPVDYFLESAKAVGLEEATFKDCMTSEKYKNDIATATQKAVRLGVQGLPYMVVNDYVSNGFTSGYDTLKTILKAGGVQ